MKHIQGPYSIPALYEQHTDECFLMQVNYPALGEVVSFLALSKQSFESLAGSCLGNEQTPVCGFRIRPKLSVDQLINKALSDETL